MISFGCPLLASFNLEDHIPANHLLRSIDQCLDPGDLRHVLADFYSPIGCPSIDPELMIRMLASAFGAPAQSHVSALAGDLVAEDPTCATGTADFQVETVTIIGHTRQPGSDYFFYRFRR
jgi:hypothetical protein